MSKCEVEDEVKWQEWKMEKEMGKVSNKMQKSVGIRIVCVRVQLLSELNSDSVKDFGEAVARLIYGELLASLPYSSLPSSSSPSPSPLHVCEQVL